MRIRWTIKNWWSKLWIRKEEFHPSLDLRSNINLGMSKERRKEAFLDLCRRRQIAHERDFD